MVSKTYDMETTRTHSENTKIFNEGISQMKREQMKLLELKQLQSSKNAKIYQEIVGKKSQVPSVSQLRDQEMPAMRVLAKTTTRQE